MMILLEKGGGGFSVDRILPIVVKNPSFFGAGIVYFRSVKWRYRYHISPTKHPFLSPSPPSG